MFSVTILGSNSALPTSARFSSAQVLNVHERFFLIDCAEGTQIQLRKFRIKISKINHIFISHLHGDHFYGIYGLISTFNLLDRKCDLHIYGPPQLNELIECHIKIQEPPLYKIVFHPTNNKEPEIIYSDKNIYVETIPLKHRIPTTGFLFKEHPKEKNIIKEKISQYNLSIKDIVKIKKGEDFVTEDNQIIPNQQLTLQNLPSKSYAYCSDTVYKPDIVPQISNIDLLYHETTFLHDSYKRAKSTHHSTAHQAALIAEAAKVKKLIIGHFSARYKDTSPLLEEARITFANTFAVNDGDTYEI